MHQADGVVAIAPVHTQDLPASMAWLDRSGALTFGSLSQDTKLQWITQSEGLIPHVLLCVSLKCSASLLGPQVQWDAHSQQNTVL